MQIPDDISTSPNNTERSRKRKWDAVPPPSNLSAEASAAVAVASTLPHRNTQAVVDKPFEILEINDHPGRRHAMLSTNIRTIESRHHVVIVSKGRYISPDQPLPSPDAPDHEKKLFLKIRGDSMQNVKDAVEALNEIMSKSDQPLVRVWADMELNDAYQSFQLLKRLEGPNQQYISFIQEETGTYIELKGIQNDGTNKQIDSQQNDRLHFVIKSQRDRPSSITRAKGLVISLVRAIQPVYDEYRMTYFGIPPPRRTSNNSNRWLSRANYQNQHRNSYPFPSQTNDFTQTQPPPPPPPLPQHINSSFHDLLPPPPPDSDVPPPPPPVANSPS